MTVESHLPHTPPQQSVCITNMPFAKDGVLGGSGHRFALPTPEHLEWQGGPNGEAWQAKGRFAKIFGLYIFQRCCAGAAAGTMLLSFRASITICNPDPLADAAGAGGPAQAPVEGPPAPAAHAWPLILGVSAAVLVAVAVLAAATTVALLHARRRRQRSSDDLAGMWLLPQCTLLGRDLAVGRKANCRFAASNEVCARNATKI